MKTVGVMVVGSESLPRGGSDLTIGEVIAACERIEGESNLANRAVMLKPSSAEALLRKLQAEMRPPPDYLLRPLHSVLVVCVCAGDSISINKEK